jgi:flagellar biosynthesis protein FliR
MFSSPLAAVTIPFFHGKPINIWFGIVLAVMISFQLLTGLRVIKVPNRVHRWNGIGIFALAAAHAVIGLMVWFDGWIY